MSASRAEQERQQREQREREARQQQEERQQGQAAAQAPGQQGQQGQQQQQQQPQQQQGEQGQQQQRGERERRRERGGAAHEHAEEEMCGFAAHPAAGVPICAAGGPSSYGMMGAGEFGPSARAFPHGAGMTIAAMHPALRSAVLLNRLQARQWVDAQIGRAREMYDDAYARIAAGLSNALDAMQLGAGGAGVGVGAAAAGVGAASLGAGMFPGLGAGGMLGAGMMGGAMSPMTSAWGAGLIDPTLASTIGAGADWTGMGGLQGLAGIQNYPGFSSSGLYPGIQGSQGLGMEGMMGMVGGTWPGMIAPGMEGMVGEAFGAPGPMGGMPFPAPTTGAFGGMPSMMSRVPFGQGMMPGAVSPAMTAAGGMGGMGVGVAGAFPSPTGPMMPGAMAAGAGAIFPRVDIVDNRDHVIVYFHLPGVAEEAVKVDVQEEDTIVVSGQRYLRVHAGAAPMQRESEDGSFKRVVRLPVLVEGKRAKANFEKGILELRIPKKFARKVEVVCGGGQQHQFQQQQGQQEQQQQ